MHVSRMTALTPHWATTPPTLDERFAIPLKRVSAKGVKNATILSHELIGCYTHFFAGRTQPCQGQDCKACDAANQRRWHGYLLCWNQSNGAKAILELTHNGCVQLIEKTKGHTTLRGLILQAQRVPEKPNGKLIVHVTKGPADTDHLPPSINVQAFLMHCWALRETTVHVHPSPVDAPARIESNTNGHCAG